MGIESPQFGVLGPEGIWERAQDGEVGWVGASGGVVLVFEALEVSSEYGIVVEVSKCLLAWI